MSAGPNVREVVKITPIDAEAISLRLVRDGVVTTYVMPPKIDAVTPAPFTLKIAQRYCEIARETAEAKLKADPQSEIYAHELGVFDGLARLIDVCLGSQVIKDELRRLHAARLRAERAAIEAEVAAIEQSEAPPA